MFSLKIETQKAMLATAAHSECHFREQITNLFNKEPDFRDSDRKPDLLMHVYSLKEGD